MMPPSIDNPRNETERTQSWLENQFEQLWCNHFADVTRPNKLVVKWGRVSRTRLGSITARGGDMHRSPEVSEIRLNPLLQSESVPLAVIWETMAHEAAHYCHGFCSPHPRKYRHPHQGNVIVKEFQNRDLLAIHTEAHSWLKTNWHPYVAATVPKPKRKKRRTYARKSSLSLLSDFQKRIKSRYRLGE